MKGELFACIIVILCELNFTNRDRDRRQTVET